MFFLFCFQKVKSLFVSPPEVQRIVMDFEAAVWSALRRVFPLATLKGCAFHWSQAVFRKVQVCTSEIYFERFILEDCVP